MDTSVIPLGERGLRGILDHVIAVGDEAETAYLEVKSGIDLARPEGVTKVAKFLLGVANRLPHDAARHFQGYAVLVIGAGKGRAEGIARGTEAHELEGRLGQYLGPQFPVFDLGRIPVGPEHEVLFIVAQPPRDGQPIYPCHKGYQGANRQDNLEDGAVYVRGSSSTRPARAGEISALVERARGARKPPVSLDVQVLGQVSRVDGVTELMEGLYDNEEELFTKLDKTQEPGLASSAITLDPFDFRRVWGPSERADRLSEWKREREEHIRQGRAYFLGAVLPGVDIRITSRDRFTARPHLILTFHDCEAFDFCDADDVTIDDVVEPLYQPTSFITTIGYQPPAMQIVPRDYPVSWDNRDGNAEVTLTPESFRPNQPWESSCVDYVLIARDPRATAVSVTWTLTEEGSDTATTGELEVIPAPSVNAVSLMDRLFYSTTARRSGPGDEAGHAATTGPR